MRTLFVQIKTLSTQSSSWRCVDVYAKSELMLNAATNQISFDVQHLSSVIDSLNQYFPDLDNRESKSWILRPFSSNEDIFKDEVVSAKVEFSREGRAIKLDFQNYELTTVWIK